MVEEPQVVSPEGAPGDEGDPVAEEAQEGAPDDEDDLVAGEAQVVSQEGAPGDEEDPAAGEPQNLAPSAVEIGAQYVAAGTAVGVDLSLLFSDPDGDELLYEATSSDTSVVAVSVSGAELEVAAGDLGAATVSVEARDPDGLSGGQSFDVTVRPRESAESDLAPGHPDPARCRPGQSLVARGYQITVLNSGPGGDTVRIRGGATDDDQ